MKMQAYYRELESSCNAALSSPSLVVNCAGLCVLPEPFLTRLSSGREDYYLQYLVAGEMDMVTAHQHWVMKPGEILLHYPHAGYQYSLRGCQEVRYYWVHFTGGEALQTVETCDLPNQRALSVGIRSPLIAYFEGMFQDFIQRDSCFPLSVNARLLGLLSHISRMLKGSQEQTSAQDGISRVIAYIHQHYHRPLSMDELCAQAHLSPSRMRFLFHQRTGLSPMDYLIGLRLNHAQMQLLQSSLSIAEIAQLSGYDDPLYFSRLFRAKLGLSPSQYRKQYYP